MIIELLSFIVTLTVAVDDAINRIRLERLRRQQKRQKEG